MDLFLFYLFFEVSLVPMYFLIGIWGGENRLVRGDQILPVHPGRISRDAARRFEDVLPDSGHGTYMHKSRKAHSICLPGTCKLQHWFQAAFKPRRRMAPALSIFSTCRRWAR